jgi:NAD(P)-dependent dehydrogenase (short-subunit alcohol dehydrogenase family)
MDMAQAWPPLRRQPVSTTALRFCAGNDEKVEAMERLNDKVVVVTGGARGIGATMAKAFAGEGAKVVVTDITDPSATVEAITKVGGQALGVKMDVTCNKEIAKMVETAEQAFGSIEGLLNNAGLFATIRLKPFWEISEDEWDEVVRVNTGAAFRSPRACCQVCAGAGAAKLST